MDEMVERVRVLAEEVLFPAALEVDRTGTIPDSNWTALADAGLYGLSAPPDEGGPGLGLPEMVEIMELLAGGCLTTTFTWIQHLGVVVGLAGTSNVELRDRWFADLVAGRKRGGVAFAGVIPDPPRMAATRVEGGWRLTGDGPFVSGWGIIDVLQVHAGDVETGDVIAVLLPAGDTRPGWTSVEPQPLVAADGTCTVSIRLDELSVTDAEVSARVPRADFLANQAIGSRLNGSLALGVARRCARLLDEAGQAATAERVRAAVDEVRGRLDAGLADVDDLLAARAAGSQLALRAAGAAMAAAGGPGLLRTHHAQRLLREAGFTLVAASRAQVKEGILAGLTGGS